MDGKKLLAYPIVISIDKDDYIVYIPDFEINTSGKNLAEAIFMARDAIGLMGITMQDEGEELPEAFSKEYDLEEGDIKTIVDIDFEDYRKKHDNRMVKKNCTIPYYLNVEAEKRGINFSRVLQEALIAKIGS